MINLQTEIVIGFDDAAAKAGVTIRTIRRWAKVGCDGIMLDAVWLGRKPVTSLEAIQRFADAQAEVRSRGQQVTVTRSGTRTKIRKALADLGVK